MSQVASTSPSVVGNGRLAHSLLQLPFLESVSVHFCSLMSSFSFSIPRVVYPLLMYSLLCPCGVVSQSLLSSLALTLVIRRTLSHFPQLLLLLHVLFQNLLLSS